MKPIRKTKEKVQERPTETTAAVVGLVAALGLFLDDRNVAGFVSTFLALLPGLVTWVVSVGRAAKA